MLRGDIWHVDFDTVQGSEASKQRPAVVVSNDRANAAATRLRRGVITVVPVTSNVAKIYPFQVFLTAATTGLTIDSKAQAEQIRSVALERLRSRIGRPNSHSSIRRCGFISSCDRHAIHAGGVGDARSSSPPMTSSTEADVSQTRTMYRQ